MQKWINICWGFFFLTLKFYILQKASGLAMLFWFQDIFASMKGAVCISSKEHELQEGFWLWETLLTLSHGHYWSSLEEVKATFCTHTRGGIRSPVPSRGMSE